MEFERISAHMIASYGGEEGPVQSWLKQASHEIFIFLMDSAAMSLFIILIPERRKADISLNA